MTFMDLALLGEDANIDDFITQWHESNTDMPLCEYLGMSEYEYSRWVSDHTKLDAILIERISLLDE